MKRIINQLLSKFGYVLYSKHNLETYSNNQLKVECKIDDIDISYLKGKLGLGLKHKLLAENKTKWLDVGSGGNFEENFFYIDTYPEAVMINKERYYRANIISLTESEVDRIGKFDFLRMQHVFEHFTMEDGITVLKNCARLLNNDGYILITTPDLNKFINLYRSHKIRNYYDWALNRIEKNSPDSFYFSVFTHSMSYEMHKWCYDAEGLMYQIESTGLFKNIKEITLNDELANIPFTHNRPLEDVCVIAQLK